MSPVPWRCCAERAVGSKMAGEAPDLSGILGSLLQNPAALNAMAGLLGGLRREGDGSREAPAAEPGDGKGEGPAAIETLAALPPHEEIPPRRGGRRQERECLLAALSPYLSPPRRRALEGAGKILEVLELFDKRL